jgi:hypothetical protein
VKDSRDGVEYCQRALVGVHEGTNYYYVWIQRGFWDPYELYSHGELVNRDGIGVDNLAFAVLADFDDDGSVELAGLQRGTSFMYGWKLWHGGQGEPFPHYERLRPSWDGYLENSAHKRVPVDELSFVEAGSWVGKSIEARHRYVRCLHARNAFQYTWGLPIEGSVWHLAADGYLKDASGDDVLVDDLAYVFSNRRDPDDGNRGGERDQLIGVRTGGCRYPSFIVWEDDDRAVRQIPFTVESTPSCTRTVMFSLDQGFINGLIANAHQPGWPAAMQRILDVLLYFSRRFTVCALLSPTIKDSLKDRLERVLDALHEAGVPFAFEVYASDIGTMCQEQPRFSTSVCGCPPQEHHCPEARRYQSMVRHPHGTSDDHRYLDYYAEKYKGTFIGMRIFEILSLHWASWVKANCERVPWPSTPYDQAVMREYLDFARDHRLFVFWTDNKWNNPYEYFYPACESAVPIRVVRQDVRLLAEDYPGLMYLGYSNNEGVRTHSGHGYYPHNYRLTNWHRRLEGIGNLKGTALSNQTWTTDGHTMLFDETLPPEEFAVWIADAFNRWGTSIVQLEPFYYLFKWDRTVTADLEDAKDLGATPWDEAGAATDNLRAVADLLGVALE